MKAEKSLSPQQPDLLPKIETRANQRALILGAITVLMSIVMALLTNSLGPLALLIIPGLVFLVTGMSKPDIVLGIFFFITLTQLSDVAIEFYGLPSIAQPLAGLLIGITVLRIFLFDERPRYWARSVYVVLLYVLILFVPTVYATDSTLAYNIFFGFLKDIIGGVIVVLLINRPISLQNIVWPIIVAGLLMGTISVFQGVTQDYDNPFGGFGGSQQQVSDEVVRERVMGPYGNPNAYAQVLVVIVAIALGRFWHEKQIILRVLAGWATIVCIIAIIFTYSRGGFLTLVATLALLFIQNRFRILPIILSFVVGATILQFLPSDYGGRIVTLLEFGGSDENQIYDESFRGRLSENIAAWRMFEDNPFFGVGLGHYKLEYQDYSREIGLDPRRVGRTAASLYLELLAELGLVGISVFVLLIYFVFTGLIRARVQFARLGMHDNAHITMSIIAGLVGYLIQATVKNSAYSNVFWLIIGLAIAAEQVAHAALNESKESLGVSD